MPVEKYAVIVAGGDGMRAGGDIPKQFRKIHGIPMLWWSVRAFHDEDPATRIILVINPGWFDLWDELSAALSESEKAIPVLTVCGGPDRGASVANGLMSVPESRNALVAVHDAARPFVTPELIRRGWECAEKDLASVPAVPVTDSLRRLTPEGSEAVDRSAFRAVQTPQCFRADILAAAYALPDSAQFTDDASRVEKSGVRITLFEGDPRNIKVTHPDDFIIAEALMSRKK